MRRRWYAASRRSRGARHYYTPYLATSPYQVRSFKEIEGGEAAHRSLGLLGQVHLAVQEVRVRTGALVVARLGAEHREDMHRLLHHALRPLEAQLGIAP